MANGFINGYPVTFLVDTGATDVALSEALAERLRLQRGGGAISQTANGPGGMADDTRPGADRSIALEMSAPRSCLRCVPTILCFWDERFRVRSNWCSARASCYCDTEPAMWAENAAKCGVFQPAVGAPISDRIFSAFNAVTRTTVEAGLAAIFIGSPVCRVGPCAGLLRAGFFTRRDLDAVSGMVNSPEPRFFIWARPSHQARTGHCPRLSVTVLSWTAR